MEYKLNIIRQEKNPKWSPKQNSYDRNEESEWLYYDTVLDVLLKEEEFIAIKKAVIEVIK